MDGEKERMTGECRMIEGILIICFYVDVTVNGNGPFYGWLFLLVT